MKLYRGLVSFGIALAAVFGCGYACSLLVNAESSWYLGLKKPVFMPKNAVMEWSWMAVFLFFIVVICLSVLKPQNRKSLAAWGITLVLNVAWIFVFFHLNLPLAALGILTIILACMFIVTWFYIKNTLELWLAMIPVLSWYMFLFILNYGIVIIN